LLSNDSETDTQLLAYCWVDRERRYFISTCSSLAEGPPCLRWRWRQLDTRPNADPVYMEVLVPQPECCDVYYGACAKIDQHNKLRQASLMLETKVKTTLWHRRVNQTLFGMCVVDAFLLAQGCQANRWSSAADFFVALAGDLIDNTYEQRALRKRVARRQASEGGHGPVLADVGPLSARLQLCSTTPTKRMKKSNNKHMDQVRCMSCRKLTSSVCRQCQQFQLDPAGHQFWICRRAGMACMGAHILKCHPTMALDEGDGKWPLECGDI
jgi:hypothetical protein